MMPNSINKYSRAALLLVLIAIFMLSACNDSCSSNPAPNVNADTKNNSVLTNIKNGNYSANTKAANVEKKMPNDSAIINNENYPTDSGAFNKPDGMPNAPVIQSDNNSYNFDPPNEPERMPNAPVFKNKSYSAETDTPIERESKPNSPVMLDLEVAVDRWSESEAASYGLRMTLISLWRRRNPTVKYYPVGIDTLTAKIKERPAFVNCQRARQLSRTMFHDEGIRTVGHLYDYLEPCGGY